MEKMVRLVVAVAGMGCIAALFVAARVDGPRAEPGVALSGRVHGLVGNDHVVIKLERPGVGW